MLRSSPSTSLRARALPSSRGASLVSRPSAPSYSVIARASSVNKDHASPVDGTTLRAQVAKTMGACLAAVLLTSSPAMAVGLESVDILPQLQSLDSADMLKDRSDVQRQKLDEADATFEKSDTLKRLLEQSAANKDKNKKEIQNKYCYRQAELGIGDCGGLRYIPGMTDSGKQKTPQWLADLLGVDVSKQDEQKLTLKDLFDGKQYD